MNDMNQTFDLNKFAHQFSEGFITKLQNHMTSAVRLRKKMLGRSTMKPFKSSGIDLRNQNEFETAKNCVEKKTKIIRSLQYFAWAIRVAECK